LQINKKRTLKLLFRGSILMFRKHLALLLLANMLIFGCGDGSNDNNIPQDEWSQAPEWTTYQGNIRHTGYMPVTLKPQVFNELWVVNIQEGNELNPVTSANGAVFVTPRNFSDNQKLYVLESETGEVRWEYAFGDIHSVNPPSYDNGKIYLTTGGHEDTFLWAFDAVSGTVDFRTSYRNQWYRYYAPTIYENNVYINGGYHGGAYAFNGKNGDQLWFVELSSRDEWTPAVDELYVYSYSGPVLTVINRNDGSIAYVISDPNFSFYGSILNLAPVLGSQNNVLVTQSGRLISFDLTNKNIGWERSGLYIGQLTLAESVIYVFNNYQVEARKESDGDLLWIWIAPDQTP
jgi:hypothetical protein